MSEKVYKDLKIQSEEQNTGKCRHKGKNCLKILYAVSCCIVISIIAFAIAMRVCYREFYQQAEKEFTVPEIASGFVPQGLEYCEEQELFLISGYMHPSGEAKVFVVEPEGNYREVNILNSDGSSFNSHAGGISLYGDYVYIAGNGKCYVFLSEEILSPEKQYVYSLGDFSTYNSSSFCCVKDGYLYIGEYYYGIKYDTAETHHVITPAGDENHAVIMAFLLNESLRFGVNTVPQKAYSIADRVQGMSITDDGKLIMSASGIFQCSQLYFYDYGKVLSGETGQLDLGDSFIPLYYCDSSALTDIMEILPKSEGITISDHKMYMLFESASNRFFYGKIIGGQYVYSLPITYNTDSCSEVQKMKIGNFLSCIADGDS